MNILNSQLFEVAHINQYKLAFQEAKPYRHLVIDEFLRPEIAAALYAHFPSMQALKTHWKRLNENKSEGSDFSQLHPCFSDLKQAVFHQEVANWITAITGIKDVFITDDSMGTGLSQGGDGSFLDVHIDFNVHHLSNVHRRLNLLLYLEKDWKEEYGGHLEMWNADVTNCVKKVRPDFNRCIIFETNEISYHGYSKISLPTGVTRKSFFAYFYTKEREGAVGYHDTIFKARPEEGMLKKVRTTVKEIVKNKGKKVLKKLGIKF